MLKDATNKEKFEMLSPWMQLVVDAIKKDIKNEHLKRDIAFVRHYFPGKNVSKLTTEELAEAYKHAISQGENTEELAEFVTNRWLLKHSDIYHHFEQELTKIDPNFTELDLLDPSTSNVLMNQAVEQFGAPHTYLFCVMNSVVFPKEIYDVLRQRAHDHTQKAQEQEAIQQQREVEEAEKRNAEQQISRLTDKYEKKLAGLQKKYQTDVECLKKQIASLQRKLKEVTEKS